MPYRHGDGGSRSTGLFVFNLGWVILSLSGLDPRNIQSRSQLENVGEVRLGYVRLDHGFLVPLYTTL